MLNKPLVSIIINCYNSDSYLKETIESVISQTYENWEIIFWDNQSEDKSAEIIHSYQDRRIKYFYSDEHTSLGQARNKALTKVNGELCKFLDADDVIYPNHLEKIVPLFYSENVGLVYTNSDILYQDSGVKLPNDRRIRESGDVFDFWLNYYEVLLPTVTIRTSLLGHLNEWFDERFSMVEEYDLFLRLSKICKTRYLYECLGFWRRHTSSLTFSKRASWLVEFKALKQKLEVNFDGLSESGKLLEMQKRIDYLSFIECLIEDKCINREFLSPYIFRDRKCTLAYLSSFFGVKFTSKLLYFARNRNR
ncbi:glycosyltransferase family 2 protein [Aeromonas hydrophila]|uniref:glycosyltransferase family 2 protein n=1 Tax=Aeromonas hydrophila TaxID=644 RepID=UPI00249F114C|nr:glycosyltransferase [Aeromonas hydrophila]WGY33618.1 glycosyltransferase [Aeromonas hydrophila]HDC4325030.1 glycosyltransferase [Aeromonas hydrophila]